MVMHMTVTVLIMKDGQICGIFNKTQPIESDFDKIVKGLAKKKIITFPDYVIMIQLWKIVFYESNKSLVWDKKDVVITLKIERKYKVRQYG